MKQSKFKNQLIDIAESLLDENRAVSFRMQGNSMFPTMKDGEIGNVEKCTAEELNTGDIIVFKFADKLIAHRLVDVFFENDIRFFVTKGDKNKINDVAFSSVDLVGKITSIQKRNKQKKVENRRLITVKLSNQIIPVYDFYLRLKSLGNRLQSGFNSLKNNLLVVSEKSEKLIFINALIAVLQGLIPFIIIVCIKFLIDFLSKPVVSNQTEQFYFVFWLITTALIFLLSAVLSEINTNFSEKLSQSVSRHIYDKMHSKHVLLDIDNYENPEKQDKIHRAVQEASYRPIKILNACLTGLKSVASALFLIGLFISIRWYLVLILLIAIAPEVFIRLKISGKLYRLKESQSTKEREMYYYNRILTGFPFAKELKLFGFADFFKQLFTTAQNSLFDQKIALRKSELRLGIFAQVFAILLIFVSLGFVSYLKLKGAISIGTVALFFFTFQRGYAVLNDLFRSITQVVEDNTFLKDFIKFLNIPTHSNTLTNSHSEFSIQKEIRFENVSFKYETSKREALKSINVTIPKGKTVAFVGANGSGKTTMIKLLCGFYMPDSGKISFDDIDASELGQQTICKNVTAVFQDFALYNLMAFKNIGLGDVNIPFDLGKAKMAAQKAGIDDVIEKLPNGYHTLLGNLFKGGEELSIGQWQKIAIARAFYRDSPLILMDEPSSALDAEAESQIVKSMKNLSHQKTAVIISHRLSTVKWVDLIYFFEDGEVIEHGNHQQLMELRGKYFSLFQSSN